MEREPQALSRLEGRSREQPHASALHETEALPRPRRVIWTDRPAVLLFERNPVNRQSKCKGRRA